MMTNSLDLVGILLEDDNNVLRSRPLHYLESDELPQYLERTSGRYRRRVFYLRFSIFITGKEFWALL